MKDLIFSLIIFLIAYLFYIVFVYYRKNILKKFSNSKEIRYLKYRYKIKVNDKNLKNISNTIFLANSFILALTVYIVSLFKNIFLEIIVGIIVIIILILSIYHLIGKYYKNKEDKHV